MRKTEDAAQKLAVEAAAGDILVFPDVATSLPERAVSNIVKIFIGDARELVSRAQ